MESMEQATETIYSQLTSDDSEVRAEFLKYFAEEAKVFSGAMARAVMAWRKLDQGIQDERRAYVSALVYSAITMHIVSFKLLLSGHMIAAGNIFRQVVESIALALLCSSKDLPVLSSFMQGNYSSKHAVRDVTRNWRRLGLIAGAHKQLQDSQEFYGQYSHITRLTLANLISFSEPGAYVGASFDAGKVDAYRKEVSGRVGLAQVFANSIEAVNANVAKW